MKIKKMRLERGWSQQYLADRSGIPRSSLAEIEKGMMLITKRDILERIAKAFSTPEKEVTADELY